MGKANPVVILVYPYKATPLFLAILGGGVAITCVAEDRVFFWLGLEMISVGFLGYATRRRRARREGIAKYFVPNSVGSLIFLFGSLGARSTASHFMVIVAMGGLGVKLGIVPLHF